MRCLHVLVLLIVCVAALAKDQLVLDASQDDPNKKTPGEKYPAGKTWMEVQFQDEDKLSPAVPTPEPAAIPHVKKEEFIDPEYLAPEAFNKGYGEGPVVETEVGTPDIESYNGIKEREEVAKAEAEAQQEEAAAETSTGEDLYTYPEILDIPASSSGERYNFDANGLTGESVHILKLANENTVVPEYDVSRIPIGKKMTRAEYEAQLETLRQEAIGDDEAVDARIQASRQKLYADWAAQKAKEVEEKAAAAAKLDDSNKYATPVLVDEHGHPVDSGNFYAAYPGGENSADQAFPKAPDYVPVDPQQEYFNRLLREQAEEGKDGAEIPEGEGDAELTKEESDEINQQQEAEGQEGQQEQAALPGHKELLKEEQMQRAQQQQQAAVQESPKGAAMQQQEAEQEAAEQQVAAEEEGKGGKQQQILAAEKQEEQATQQQQQEAAGQQANQQQAEAAEGQQEAPADTVEGELHEIKQAVETLSERVDKIENGGEAPVAQQQQAKQQQQEAAEQQATEGEQQTSEEAQEVQKEQQDQQDAEAAGDAGAEAQSSSQEANRQAAAQQQQADQDAASEEVAAEGGEDQTEEAAAQQEQQAENQEQAIDENAETQEGQDLTEQTEDVDGEQKQAQQAQQQQAQEPTEDAADTQEQAQEQAQEGEAKAESQAQEAVEGGDAQEDVAATTPTEQAELDGTATPVAVAEDDVVTLESAEVGIEEAKAGLTAAEKFLQKLIDLKKTVAAKATR